MFWITRFNQPIGSWDVSSVTNMRQVSNERVPCCLSFEKSMMLRSVRLLVKSANQPLLSLSLTLSFSPFMILFVYSFLMTARDYFGHTFALCFISYSMELVSISLLARGIQARSPRSRVCLIIIVCLTRISVIGT
jgi:hypothetical protein